MGFPAGFTTMSTVKNEWIRAHNQFVYDAVLNCQHSASIVLRCLLAVFPPPRHVLVWWWLLVVTSGCLWPLALLMIHSWLVCMVR